jgi:hypothetical protein
MSTPRRYRRLPLGVPHKGNARHYMLMYRWLERHQGPMIHTEEQLRWALTQPEIFFIVAEKSRAPEHTR